MVIEFNSIAEIRQKYTTDLEALRRAVENDRADQRATHMEEALNLADSLANPTKSTDNQAVIPDGADPTKARTYVDSSWRACRPRSTCSPTAVSPTWPASRPATSTSTTTASATEGQSDNVGIVAFNAQRDDKATGNLRVFLRVLNFRGEGVHTQVKLDEMDWTKDNQLQVVDSHIKPLDHRPVDRYPADADKKGPPTRTPGEADVTFDTQRHRRRLQPRPARQPRRYTRTFSRSTTTAWLVAGVVRKAHVLIVTDGNEILHNFFDLEATQKVAVVTIIATADLKDQDEVSSAGPGGGVRSGDVRSLPAGQRGGHAAGRTPTSSTTCRRRGSKADMPELKDAHIRNPTSKHPLMEGLSGLDEISPSDAFRFELDPDKNPGVPPRVPKLLEIRGRGGDAVRAAAEVVHGSGADVPARQRQGRVDDGLD